MNTPEPAGTAYSYIRFSSRKQERGDSIRRQEELREQWLRRNPRVTLDTSLTLADLGVSAFRGKHRTDDQTALSQFLQAVESGRVKAGSYLIVESLDRLTREQLGGAVELVLGLVNRGVRIVQLHPVETVLAKPVNMTSLMLAIVELSQGNSESVMKSERVGATWTRKRRGAVDGKPITKQGPAWLVVKNGKFDFRPGAKEVVRRVFALATAGHGARAIAKVLNDDGVKLWTGKPWYECYVRNVLSGREALGEYQPRRSLPAGGRENDGEPVVGYYPAAVTEAEWQAAKAAMRGRLKRGGRPTTHDEHVNILQGLTYDARSGQRLQVHFNRQRMLLADGAKNRGETGVSFPLAVLERAALSKLKEIDPREILAPDSGPDKVAELNAKITRIDARLKQLTAQFGDDEDEIPEVVGTIREKHAERKTLVERLDAAKTKAASPLSSAWGETKGLIETLDAAKDQRDVRVRLRQVLARIVERIDCLFTPGGGRRVGAVQVRFAGGRHRDYLIHYTPPHGPTETPAKWSAESFAEAGLPDMLDLRQPDHTKRLEAALVAWKRPNPSA